MVPGMFLLVGELSLVLGGGNIEGFDRVADVTKSAELVGAFFELNEPVAVPDGFADAALADDEDGVSASPFLPSLQQSCLPFGEQQKSPLLTPGPAHWTMNWFPAVVPLSAASEIKKPYCLPEGQNLGHMEAL